MRGISNNVFIPLLSMIVVTSVYPTLAANSDKHDNGWHSNVEPIQNYPDGATLSLTFKSEIDRSIQPLLVKIPKGYTPEKSWPLMVTLHGLGGGPILAPELEAMVQIGPYGRGSVWYAGLGERDVFECINMARKLFHIDDDRSYLCGFSMEAIGTFDLGLKHPDLWAACVPVCGRWTDLDMVENARHLPFWVNTGKKDIMIPPKDSKQAYERASLLGFAQWRYTEHANMGHDFSINWKEVEKWLLTKKRAKNPKRVTFRTKDMRANRAYWFELTGIKRYGLPAQVDAEIDGQKVNIRKENISNYTLRLNDSPIDVAQRMQIFDNGVKIFDGFLDDGGCFVRTPKNEGDASKRPGLSGPLWDLYSSSCVLVYGTNSKKKSLIRAARNCAESFCDPAWMNRVTFRIIPDKEVTEQDIKGNNLVLFGNPEMNEILARLFDRLPIHVDGSMISVKSAGYSTDNTGFVLTYPNPLNQEKYVAVFSGSTAETINCFDKIWPELHSVPRNIDFGLFRIGPKDGSVKWLSKGVFGTNWDWQR